MQDAHQSKLSLFIVLGLGLLVLGWKTTTNSKLTIYCAHDSVFAEALSGLTPQARSALIAGLTSVTTTLSQAVCDAAADVKDI